MDRAELDNSAHMVSLLRDMTGVQILSHQAIMRRSGIVTFRSEKVSAISIKSALAAQGINCAVRDKAIRLSPHFYQGEEEIEEVFGVIKQVLEENSS